MNKSIKEVKFILFVYIIVISSLTISCSNGRSDIVETVNLKNSFKDRDEVNLSSIAEKVEYVNIQTADGDYIGNIRPNKNIRFIDGDIYINNIGQVLRFNSEGKFINQIGVSGEGPGEYTNAFDFSDVEYQNKRCIAVYSREQGKTFIYDFEGIHLKSLKGNLWSTGLAANGSDLIYINSIGDRANSGYFTFNFFDVENNLLLHKMMFRENEKLIEKNIRLAASSQFSSYTLNNTLSYWESNYDTIWRITDKFKKTPSFVLNIGKNKMPFEKQSEENVFDFSMYSKYDRIEHITETENYIFSDIFYEKFLQRVCYNKKTKEMFNVKFNNSFETKPHFAFKNDIDGGYPFWPMGKMDDNKVFMLIHREELIDYLSKQNNQSNIGYPNALHKFDFKSNPNGNPLLIIVTLK